MLDFPHSLVISSFLLQLVPTVALSQRDIAITWRERVEDPYVEKCALSVTRPKTLRYNIKPGTIFPVSCPMDQVFISDWL